MRSCLKRFRNENIPIMVGTQMVTKGLNFPNVTLVGVISADQSLYAGDYRAGERTFSLITQVVGRSGRGDKPGRAVIQTFTPENETIRYAADQDYESFFESEIELRRLQNAPPFKNIFSLTVTGVDEEQVEKCCAYLSEWLRNICSGKPEIDILGPAPLPVVRVNNRYRYRINVCCESERVDPTGTVGDGDRVRQRQKIQRRHRIRGQRPDRLRIAMAQRNILTRNSRGFIRNPAP